MSFLQNPPGIPNPPGTSTTNTPRSIDNVYVQTFEKNVRYLAQQKLTKLRGTVIERHTQSVKHSWERLGTLDAIAKTTAVQPTPTQAQDWSRRLSIPSTMNLGTSTELEDGPQMLIDPNSALTRAVAMGMNRAVDDIIIAAATGTALDGDGSTAIAFPPTQQIDDAANEITFGKITEVQEKFMNNNIDPDVPKVAVVSPAQVRALMNLTEQTSSDYVHRESLQRLSSSGIVPNWLGFTWIVSTRLLHPAAGTTNCLFYTPEALGLQVNTDITAQIAQDPSISFSWRIYSHMLMGAVRVEDEQIVALEVKDVA